MLKSTTDRYGAIAVSMHWLTAIFLLVALVSGFRAGNIVEPVAKVALLRVHIPAAIMVLLLTVCRIVWWWLFDRKPLPVQGAPSWQEWLARAVHLAFYVVILGMIASGVGIIALSGAAQAIFGAGTELPNFYLYPPRLPHGLGANLLLALLSAHIGAALFHQFVRSDRLLQRMWYRR
ncbi:cytochrome b/b6 domain-containing protein [Rhizobium sophoriradicis]|uniref:cytochrome b n=1 Tax=Rhizobium sophoriradicis TaxID=1535245 RepID=UPI0016102310|nr:cytochrome b/b6 domain-containing protein [Rhizobium leguminosarum bv. phaseoli]